MVYIKTELHALLIKHLFASTRQRLYKNINNIISHVGKKQYPRMSQYVFWCKYNGKVYTSTALSASLLNYVFNQEVHLPIECKEELKITVDLLEELLLDKAIITSFFQKIFNTFSRLEDVCFVLPDCLSKVYKNYTQNIVKNTNLDFTSCRISDNASKFITDNQRDIDGINERVLTNLLLNDTPTN